ncbi:DMT family transporter [Sphingomonas sp. So64.6b]|uniref:DMT family transporter n=1 Tax=Sphingomonas sp. So64.6b TaxID=2997354 RepID=UPI001603392B|nr:DMT family transporter [Sphingomonas sp. So64.6b]QNA84743.1 DMT family transporter [Sphingomonas sp. So64.6b]
MAETNDRILPAIAMRLMSVALFASMNAVIKLAEERGATLGEILFFRQFGAAILLTAILIAGPGLRSVTTQRLPAHLARAALGLSAMACTFTTVLVLPLAESTTLGFTMPIFATILGALILREPTGWHRWAAVAAGFAGVLIVAQPGSGHFPIWGAVSGLAAAFLTASVSILLRQISRTEGTMTTVFWFSTLSLVPLGIVYAFVVQPHAPITWILLIGIGLIGGVAQLAMTSALRLGPVSVVVPMDYSSLLWATAYGWLIFGVLPSTWTWIGAPVIIASGLYIVWREHVRRTQLTLETVPQI